MIKIKSLIFLVFTVVVGLLLAPVCASEGAKLEVESDTVDDTVGATTYTTGTQYFTKSPVSDYETFFEKMINNQDYACGYYNSRNNNLQLHIKSWNTQPYNKMTECVVEFRKTENGQVKKSTLTFQPRTEGWMNSNPPYVEYYPRNNYKPYSAIINYQKK